MLTDSVDVYNKVKATLGSAIDKNNPLELSNYPYPILVANVTKGSDEIYSMVKAMVEHYDDYKDAAKGANGWKLEKCRIFFNFGELLRAMLILTPFWDPLWDHFGVILDILFLTLF